MKITDNRWEHVFAAVAKDFDVLKKIVALFENRKDVRKFEKKSANGHATVFVPSSKTGDRFFFGWSGDEGSPSPEFAHFHVRTEGASFELESDAFWWYPFYFFQDDDVFIGSNRLGNVIEWMRLAGRPVLLNPEAGYLSIAAHFVTNGISPISKTGAFPYGTKAVFPISDGSGGIVRFDKVSRPAFNPKGIPLSKTVDDYLKNADRTIGKIVEKNGSGKIGLLFTGGLDSSAILASLARNGQIENTVAVTVSFMGSSAGEDENAKETAEYFKVERRIVELVPEDLFRLPEAIWISEDLTDVYGYGISLLRAYETNPDVCAFLNGWGTDAAIWSTPAVASAVWKAFHGTGQSTIDPNVERFFDPKATFDGIRIQNYFNEKRFNRQEWIERLSWLTLVGTDAFWFGMDSFLPDTTWWNGKYVPAYRDPYWMDEMDLRFHDFVTLIDYDGLAHRFGDLYKKIGGAAGVGTFSPFWAYSVRQTLFDAEIESKFNPTHYPTSVRDNQWFYKKAFWNSVPEWVRHRKKRVWSIPNVRHYLEWDTTRPVAKAVFERFRTRGVVSDSFMSKAGKIWDYGETCRLIGKKPSEGENAVFRSNLSFVWRILVLEIYLQLFVDGKGFEGDSPKLDLRDFV